MSLDTLALVLAGGRGERLSPLTDIRAKPAVSFGGKYKIVDFVLSNLFNSGLKKIYIATQYKSFSLDNHIERGWRRRFGDDEFLRTLPPMQMVDAYLYRGTADVVFHNQDFLIREKENKIAVFGGDHIYKMDIAQMIDFHNEKGAELTIAAIPVEKKYASEFGIVEVDDNGFATRFLEKPKDQNLIDSINPAKNKPDFLLTSMGNYIFDKKVLLDEVIKNASDLSTRHDFGKDIIPKMLDSKKKIAIYDFSTNSFNGITEKERGYWKDVGTLDAYYDANMELIGTVPVLNLYNDEWLLRTNQAEQPPVKTGDYNELEAKNVQSLVCDGSIITGGKVYRSILSPKVIVKERATVTDSIIFERVVIEPDSCIDKAIIDKDNTITKSIAEDIYKARNDLNLANKIGIKVSKNGVVVVPKALYSG